MLGVHAICSQSVDSPRNLPRLSAAVTMRSNQSRQRALSHPAGRLLAHPPQAWPCRRRPAAAAPQPPAGLPRSPAPGCPSACLQPGNEHRGMPLSTADATHRVMRTDEELCTRLTQHGALMACTMHLALKLATSKTTSPSSSLSRSVCAAVACSSSVLMACHGSTLMTKSGRATPWQMADGRWQGSRRSRARRAVFIYNLKPSYLSIVPL